MDKGKGSEHGEDGAKDILNTGAEMRTRREKIKKGTEK